jgi:hypothetical protein
MCLDYVIDSNYKPKETILAWKVFRNDDGKLSSQCYGTPTWTGYYPCGKWNRSIPMRVTPRESSEVYLAGFHSFLVRKDARAWLRICSSPKELVVRRVKIRGRKTLGCQTLTNRIDKSKVVVVAEEMMVLEDK